MPKTFAAAAILALSLLACGGGDDGEDADGGADASPADYSAENCYLFSSGQITGQICCYSGGEMPGCGRLFAGADGLPMFDIDGTIGCIDQIVETGEPTLCAFFECETFVDDVSECE
jgi:hypothetical protein